MIKNKIRAAGVAFTGLVFAGGLIVLAPNAPAMQSKMGPSRTSGNANAKNGSVASGAAVAKNGSVSSGDSVAKNGSVSSGCSEATNKSSASGGECRKKRETTTTTMKEATTTTTTPSRQMPSPAAPASALRAQATFAG